MEEARKRSKWIQWISLGFVIILTVEVVLLIRQNKELKDTIQDLSSASQPEALKPGEHAMPVKLQRLDGRFTEVTYATPAKKHLLFVLSTTCPHCENTMINWRVLAFNNDSTKCSIVGISMDNLEKTKQFASTRTVGFDVMSVVDGAGFNKNYKISAFPMTILIKGDATVEKAWMGELSEEQMNEIAKRMGV